MTTAVAVQCDDYTRIDNRRDGSWLVFSCDMEHSDNFVNWEVVPAGIRTTKRYLRAPRRVAEFVEPVEVESP